MSLLLKNTKKWGYKGRMYISITGLRLKNRFMFIPFAWHVMRSFKQAKKAEGNLHCALNNVNGVHHTLTAWESKKHMQQYIYSGAHKKAIVGFRRIATGKTLGYEGDELPSWEEAHKIWQKNGRDY